MAKFNNDIDLKSLAPSPNNPTNENEIEQVKLPARVIIRNLMNYAESKGFIKNSFWAYVKNIGQSIEEDKIKQEMIDKKLKKEAEIILATKGNLTHEEMRELYNSNPALHAVVKYIMDERKIQFAQKKAELDSKMKS